MYYLNSKEVLKRCHSDSSRKPDLKGDALPLLKADGVWGRKQRSFWADDLSVIYLVTARDEYTKTLPRCQGVSVQIRSCSRSRKSQQGDTAGQTQ